MMTDLRELQKLVNRAAKANSEAFRATDALNEYCEREYGCTPSDIDADEIIDGVLGANGESPGMKARHFDQIMREGTANVV